MDGRIVGVYSQKCYAELWAGEAELWVRPCYEPQEPWRLTRPWAASEEPSLFFEGPINPCDLHLLVNLDGDGEVELIGPPDRDLQFNPFYAGTTYYGLALWRLDASGVLDRHTLLGSQVLVPHRAIASDLTGDGRLDLAVVDGNLATGPALVVLVGQHDGVPLVEGRYRLPGTGAAKCSPAMSTAMGCPIWSCWEGVWKAVRAGPSSFSTRVRRPPLSPPRPRPRPQPLPSVPTIPTHSIRNVPLCKLVIGL